MMKFDLFLKTARFSFSFKLDVLRLVQNPVSIFAFVSTLNGKCCSGCIFLLLLAYSIAMQSASS